MTKAPPQKDLQSQQPIPAIWRPVLRSIANAFAAKDYGLSRGVPGVERLSSDDEAQICDAIADYGAMLSELPDASWDSSVCQWYGTHWEALVDLWTEEEGRSDLVLCVRVMEDRTGFRFKIHLVYVP